MWQKILQRQHPEGPQGGPRRVLLVTADGSVRGLVSTFLSSMGCSCVIAASSEEFADLEHTTFDAVLIDGADLGIHAEQSITRILESHPALAPKILVLTSGVTDPELLKLVERHGLRRMSRQILLQHLWDMLQEIFAGPRIVQMTVRNKLGTQLIFDRLHAPLPDGVHSLPATGRELAYKHKDTLIDVIMEPKVGSGRVSLAGHVIGQQDTRDENNGLSVLLTHRRKTLARTKTNKLGKFNLEFDLVEDAGLQIRFGRGSWASIPLGKMDWVRKQLLSG